tara:strand:- start:60 stop:233 length:174 start_codon:yes stop_codon:yes gene_type:complete
MELTESEKILRAEITIFDWDSDGNEVEMIPYNDALRAVKKALEQVKKLNIDVVSKSF